LQEIFYIKNGAMAFSPQHHYFYSLSVISIEDADFGICISDSLHFFLSTQKLQHSLEKRQLICSLF